VKKTYFIKINSKLVNWVLITVLWSCSSSVEQPPIQKTKEEKEPSPKQLKKEDVSDVSKEKPAIEKWPDSAIKSEKSYQEILIKKSTSLKSKVKALINLSLMDVHRKKFKSAKANISRIINFEKALQKEDPKFHLTLMNKRDLVQAYILFKEGAFLLAVQKIESILEENNEDPMAYSFLAYIYLEMGSTELAKKVVSRGLKVSAQDNSLNFIRARILLQQSPESAEGKEILMKLAKSVKIAKNTPYQVLALNCLGELSLKTDNFLEAETYLKQAIKLDPQFIAAFNNLAVAQKGLKKYQRAKEIWLSILKNYGDVKEVHFNLASLYRSYLNDPQKVMEHEAIFKRLSNKDTSN